MGVEVQGVDNEPWPGHLEVYTSRDAHWSIPGPATPEKKTVAPTAASQSPSEYLPVEVREADQWEASGCSHEAGVLQPSGKIERGAFNHGATNCNSKR